MRRYFISTILLTAFFYAGYGSASPQELLHYGIINCDEELIKRALLENADVNLNSTTDEWSYAALHHAVIFQCYEALDLLLSLSNLKIDIKDDVERTPLNLAAYLPEKEIYNRLLRAGADPNIPDYDDMTPAEIAEATTT